jgi:two-component system, cell cycle response regulator
MSANLSRRRQDGDLTHDAPSIRVLLIDDDDNFRHWLATLMRRLGFAVETAIDGMDGLAKLHVRPFDLVISDFEMPKMNGFELIREIRATPALTGQYAVMLTSHDDADSKVQALTIGYDDFLTKSCTEVEVVAKIVAARRMLSRQQLVSVAVREWQVAALRDELTGVSVRRTFLDETERHLAENRPVGIAIIDLNGFKGINDTFGHLIGDRILRDIGALFVRRTRTNDLIARYGGDEFVLLATDLPLEDIIGAAQRLADEIAALQWIIGDVMVQCTASFGVAHSSLLHQGTVEQLLEAADRDLYAKKWVLKNPGAPPVLYEYPGQPSVAPVVPLPADQAGLPVAQQRPAED